jgi:hypothetical protein
VNRAVDVVQFHPSVGGDGIGLVELFGIGVAVRSIGSEGENKQGTDGSQNAT